MATTPISELRTKKSECRYRIPDVALLNAEAPRDPVALVPPLAAFEILSPEDPISRLLIRLADFEGVGVGALYVIDPADNTCRRYTAGSLQIVKEIAVCGRNIDVAEVVDLIW